MDSPSTQNEPDPLRVMNLTALFQKIPDYWHPRIAGEINGMQVKLAKIQGEFHWHHHETEDELFLVIHGRLEMRLRSGNKQLGPGEFLIVPHGVEHCPAALTDEAHVLLFEPASTLNTGTARNDRTVDHLEWL